MWHSIEFWPLFVLFHSVVSLSHCFKFLFKCETGNGVVGQQQDLCVRNTLLPYPLHSMWMYVGVYAYDSWNHPIPRQPIYLSNYIPTPADGAFEISQKKNWLSWLVGIVEMKSYLIFIWVITKMKKQNLQNAIAS